MQHLRRLSPEQIIKGYARFSTDRFSEHGVPVVVAARNEENDLPATLVSLADSREAIRPIVVENGSHDRTAEFARAMGATVLTGALHKMAAQQQGVAHVLAEEGRGRPILFTDADTLVGRDWAGALAPDVQLGDKSQVRYGSVAFAHGEAVHVDAIRTAYAFTKDLNRLVRNKRPVGRGASMGIYFSEQDDFYEGYMQLAGDLFVAEEEAIANTVEGVGGKVARALGLRALVVTRGDRCSSVSQLIRLTGAGGFDERIALYKRDYGAFTPNRRP